MKITCAFQYELYVDETRRAALSRNAGCRRFVFNKALGIQNERKSKGENFPGFAWMRSTSQRPKKRFSALRRSMATESMCFPPHGNRPEKSTTTAMGDVFSRFS